MFIGKLAGKPSPKPPHFSDFVSVFFYFYLEDKEYAKKKKKKKKKIQHANLIPATITS